MSLTQTNSRMISNVGTGANQLVQLDANAKLPAVDGSQLTNVSSGESNNPSFSARLSDHQDVSDNVLTKIAFDTTDFATSGTYNTSSYRFTPAVAGNYQFMIQIVGNSLDSSNLHAIVVKLYKNGSPLSSHVDGVVCNWSNNYILQAPISFNVCATSDTDDYFEVYAAVNSSSGNPRVSKYGTYFSAFRISGSA